VTPKPHVDCVPMTWRGSLWPLSQLKVLRTILPVGGPEILQRLDIPHFFVAFATKPIMINPPLFVFDGVRSAVGLLNSQAQKH